MLCRRWRRNVMDQTLAMETTHFRTYTGLMQPMNHLLHHSTQNTVNFLLSQTCAHLVQDNWSTKVFWRLQVWYFQLSPLAMSDRLLYHTVAWHVVKVLWVYDYKFLIPSLIQRTIDNMLKGKSFLEFNSFHNKPVLIAGQLVRPWCQSLVVQHDEQMSYNMNQVVEKFMTIAFLTAFPIQLSYIAAC